MVSTLLLPIHKTRSWTNDDKPVYWIAPPLHNIEHFLEVLVFPVIAIWPPRIINYNWDKPFGVFQEFPLKIELEVINAFALKRFQNWSITNIVREQSQFVFWRPSPAPHVKFLWKHPLMFLHMLYQLLLERRYKYQEAILWRYHQLR